MMCAWCGKVEVVEGETLCPICQEYYARHKAWEEAKK
jgi:uncharacterized Zn finger protein (UPF0148 family)